MAVDRITQDQFDWSFPGWLVIKGIYVDNFLGVIVLRMAEVKTPVYVCYNFCFHSFYKIFEQIQAK